MKFYVKIFSCENPWLVLFLHVTFWKNSFQRLKIENWNWKSAGDHDQTVYNGPDNQTSHYHSTCHTILRAHSQPRPAGPHYK